MDPGSMTHAALMSAASRALAGGTIPGLDPAEDEQGRNAWPETQQHIDGVQSPHGYGSVRMPYAPQVAARTSPGTVPMKTS